METDDFVLLERWIDNWKNLIDFEIVPVRTSAGAANVRLGRLVWVGGALAWVVSTDSGEPKSFQHGAFC
jgi:hypothetical protein